MTPLLPVGVRIFVASESIDGRRSFDGLAAIVKETLKRQPLFCGASQYVTGVRENGISLLVRRPRVSQHAT